MLWLLRMCVWLWKLVGGLGFWIWILFVIINLIFLCLCGVFFLSFFWMVLIVVYLSVSFGYISMLYFLWCVVLKCFEICFMWFVLVILVMINFFVLCCSFSLRFGNIVVLYCRECWFIGFFLGIVFLWKCSVMLLLFKCVGRMICDFKVWWMKGWLILVWYVCRVGVI